MDKINSDALRLSVDRNMVLLNMPIILKPNDKLTILTSDYFGMPIIKLNGIVTNAVYSRDMLSNYLVDNGEIDHKAIDSFLSMAIGLVEPRRTTPSRGGVTGTRNSKFRR